MSPDRGAGRFAPSPSGPLHLGSLLAAAASYLDARRLGVPWYLRFDDLDAPRNVPGAEDAIRRSLEYHGLYWDGPVRRQSEHLDRYAAALGQLHAQDALFYCRCSRKTLQDTHVYPGTCRSDRMPAANRAARIRVEAAVVSFDDLIQGPQRQNLGTDTGDFVVRRRDGIVAYHLATAVDDGAPDIARVIRGRDLLEATAPQMFLMQRLGLTPPEYGHLPLLLNHVGQKLSKQNLAPPLDDRAAAANLALVLEVLGVDAGPEAPRRDCPSLLAEAVPRWSLAATGRDDLQIETG